jgi:hypothetical protein
MEMNMVDVIPLIATVGIFTWILGKIFIEYIRVRFNQRT